MCVDVYINTHLYNKMCVYIKHTNAYTYYIYNTHIYTHTYTFLVQGVFYLGKALPFKRGGEENLFSKAHSITAGPGIKLAS